MISGSLPTATTRGTWSEQLEVVDIETGQPFDMSHLTEITLQLEINQPGLWNRTPWLTLKLSSGQITLPSPGIIEWTADAGLMGTLQPGEYEAIILFENSDATLPLMLGNISVVT